MGLRLAGLSTYSSFGFATAIAVVDRGRRRADPGAGAVPLRRASAAPAAGSAAAGSRTEARRSPRVGRSGSADRPLPWAIGAALLMIAIALPALAMRTWPQDASRQSTETTTRRAFDLVADEYGAGANGPLTVVVDRSQLGAAEVDRVAAELEGRDDIVAVTAAGRLPRRRDQRSSRPSPRSVPPTSAPPAWSTTCGPRCPTAPS